MLFFGIEFVSDTISRDSGIGGHFSTVDGVQKVLAPRRQLERFFSNLDHGGFDVRVIEADSSPYVDSQTESIGKTGGISKNEIALAMKVCEERKIEQIARGVYEATGREVTA